MYQEFTDWSDIGWFAELAMITYEKKNEAKLRHKVKKAKK